MVYPSLFMFKVEVSDTPNGATLEEEYYEEDLILYAHLLEYKR